MAISAFPVPCGLVQVANAPAGRTNKLCRQTGFFQPFGEPHLNETLTRHTEPIRGLVQGLDHPFREIHVNFGWCKIEVIFLTSREMFHLAKIEVLADVFAAIELGVEIRGAD
jgi:hypothetical protein